MKKQLFVIFTIFFTINNHIHCTTTDFSTLGYDDILYIEQKIVDRKTPLLPLPDRNDIIPFSLAFSCLCYIRIKDWACDYKVPHSGAPLIYKILLFIFN